MKTNFDHIKDILKSKDIVFANSKTEEELKDFIQAAENEFKVLKQLAEDVESDMMDSLLDNRIHFALASGTEVDVSHNGSMALEEKIEEFFTKIVNDF